MKGISSWSRTRANALGLGLLLLGLAACDRSAHGAAQQPPTPAQTAPQITNPGRAALLASGSSSIADVAAKVTPSVVNVFSEKVTHAGSPDMSPLFGDPFFRFFFNQPGHNWHEAPERKEQSLGSGVIVSSDGIIITNNHVVAQADKIRVALKDGRELEAKVVGTDPKSDVAVLRIDAKNLPALPIEDSSKVRIGDLVLAIGNPFGIGQTVTMGIVSAVGRANMGITDYEDFIQTDAAINPGNSGGALVTMDGRLVGINTAIVSRSGGYQGIGFAIPSNMAIQVKDAILKDGKVVRGWLGVSIQNVTEDLGKSLNVAPRAGVLVSDVSTDSPAAKGGLQRGDIITKVDGQAMHDTAHLRNLIAMDGKDKKVHLDVLRSGKSLGLDVTLGEAPSDGGVAALGHGDQSAEGAGLFAGVQVQALDESQRATLHVPNDIKGVVVESVGPDSPAASMGLRPGDVIVEVNRAATPDVAAFRKAADQSQQRALVLVYRDGVTLFMSLSK